ncbi:MAG: hypothetical protein ACRC3B_00490, partial [Bacteroidia bacterium]
LTWAVSQMIVRKYKGMRTKAVQQSVLHLMQNLNADERFVKQYRNSFEEWALLAAVYPVKSNLFPLLKEIISLKEDDPYLYTTKIQELLNAN